MLWIPPHLTWIQPCVYPAMEGWPFPSSLHITYSESSCLYIIDTNECWIRWIYRACRGVEQGERFKMECSVVLFFLHALLVFCNNPFSLFVCLCLSFCMSVSSVIPSLTFPLVIAYRFSGDLGMSDYYSLCRSHFVGEFPWTQAETLMLAG